jgi:prepilin-type N-terminal cleavage/methylation domain-containing protein
VECAADDTKNLAFERPVSDAVLQCVCGKPPVSASDGRENRFASPFCLITTWVASRASVRGAKNRGASGPISQRGFSIVEVMMAITILLVGFIGMMQAVTIGSEALDTARKQEVANQIVTAELEKLRSGPWTRIAQLPATASVSINASGALSGDTTSFALGNYSSDASDDNLVLSKLAPGFTCSFERVRLRPAAATASTVTFVKLTYTVSWTSSTGQAHRHVIETFLAMNGLHLSFQQS